MDAATNKKSPLTSDTIKLKALRGAAVIIDYRRCYLLVARQHIVGSRWRALIGQLRSRASGACLQLR